MGQDQDRIVAEQVCQRFSKQRVPHPVAKDLLPVVDLPEPADRSVSCPLFPQVFRFQLPGWDSLLQLSYRVSPDRIASIGIHQSWQIENSISLETILLFPVE